MNTKKVICFIMSVIILCGVMTSCDRIRHRLDLPFENVDADKLSVRLSELLEVSGNSPEEIFTYVRHGIRYKTTEKDTPEAMALHAINYRSGACYHFSALAYYMLDAAGYETMMINGSGLDVDGDGVRDAAEHYWDLIRIDGNWYHYDTLQDRYMLTDAEMRELGYEWDETAWPASADQPYRSSDTSGDTTYSTAVDTLTETPAVQATDPVTGKITELITDPVTEATAVPAGIVNDYLRSKLDKVLSEKGTDISAIYNYVYYALAYKKVARADTEDMALYALNYHRGACYHFAALTYCLLIEAGYDARLIYGAGLDINGDGVSDASEHWWCLVNTDGVWRHLDSLQQQYLKTDAQLQALGYAWETSEYPACD